MAGGSALALSGLGKNLGAALGAGRDVFVDWPSAGQSFVIEEQMILLAQKDYCVPPLQYVTSQPESVLGGDDRAAALSLALEKGAGGGVPPSGMAMSRAYNSLAGLRYRLHALTRKTHPELTGADFERWVTDETRPAVIDALAEMLRALDPKSATPASRS